MEADVARARRVAAFVAADWRYEKIEVHRDLTGRERFILAVRNMRS